MPRPSDRIRKYERLEPYASSGRINHVVHGRYRQLADQAQNLAACTGKMWACIKKRHTMP